MPSREEIAQKVAKEYGLKEASTPGPWEYQEESDAYTHIVRGPNDFFIAQFSQDTTGRSEANAKLLAAAPALRDALIEAEVRNEELKEELENRIDELQTGLYAFARCPSAPTHCDCRAHKFLMALKEN